MGRARIVLFSHDSRYADAFSEYCGIHEKERITVLKTVYQMKALMFCLQRKYRSLPQLTCIAKGLFCCQKPDT